MPARRARRKLPEGVVAGVEATLDSLARADRLDELDDALVATVRATAEAFEAVERDADASFVEWAAVARVHLAALERLRAVAGGSGADPLAALVAALRTPLGDKANT